MVLLPLKLDAYFLIPTQKLARLFNQKLFLYVFIFGIAPLGFFSNTTAPMLYNFEHINPSIKITV